MRARRFTLRLVAALQAFLLVSSLFLPALTAAATWTDQVDYAPGSVVTISGDNSDGAGYLPSETVEVSVSGPNGYVASCTAVTDDAGAWSCEITLWDNHLAVGTYSYTTLGRTSGATENGTFTDAININSFVSNCTTASDSFASGATVCAKVTGLPGGAGGSSGAVEWWARGATSATRTTAFSGVSGNLTDSFAPATCGTWTIKVYSPSATLQDDDTFDVTGCAVGTTTTVNAPSITYNANGSVTVTVTAASGTPTGNVSLSVDGGAAVSIMWNMQPSA